MNEDGRADVIVGAYGEPNFQGTVFAYLGLATYPAAPAVISTPDFVVPSMIASGSIAAFGLSVTTCASRHGPPAIAIGAPVESHPAANEGVERIFAGRDAWPNPVGAADATLVDPDGALNGSMGIAARCADVTADGNDDLIVGAPTGDDTGTVYVYADAGSLPALPLVALTSGNPTAGILGTSVAVTDFDGDGVMDVFAGGPRLPPTDSGQVLGWLGRATWPSASMSPDITISNPSGVANEWFGRTAD